MSETQQPQKYPRCHFCKREIGEGNKLKSRYSGKTVIVCHDCSAIIGDLVHDFASDIFAEINQMMSDPSKTWKIRLVPWQIEEDPTE